MLLTSNARRSAVFVPVLLLAFTGMIVAVAVLGVVRQPGWGSAAALLVSVGLFLLPFSGIRRLRRTGDRLVAQGPFSQEDVSATAAALGVRVQVGAKGGATYIVFAHSSDGRIDLCDFMSMRGADAGRAKLTQVLGLEAKADTGWIEARRILDGERAAQEVATRRAKAQIDAYYASGKFRRVVLWMLAGLAVYMLVMGFVVFVWRP